MDIRGVEVNDVWRYVLSVLNNPDRISDCHVNVTLHYNGGDLVPIRVSRLVDNRNYSKHFGQKLHLVCDIGLGDYHNIIQKHKEYLTVTIEVDDQVTPIKYERYRAVPIINGDTETASGDPGISNKDQLNTTDIVSITLECGSPLHEALRKENIKSFPLRTTLKNAIENLYAPKRWTQWDTMPTHPVPTVDDVYYRRYQGEIGVDCVQPENTNTYDVVFFPREINFTQIVPYLQSAYGLWSEGAGRFHQHGLWYVYPLFNKTRWDKEERTLTIVNIPEAKLPETERNYEVVDRNLFMLANNDVSVKDDNWLGNLTEGNGIRYLNANRVQDGWAIRRQGVVKFQQSDNIISRSVEQRDDNLNEFLPETTVSRGNHYTAFSRLAHKRGKIITFRWRNGDPELLYPGMPTAWLHAKDDVVRKLTGTLLGVQTEYRKTDEGNWGSNVFGRDCVLSLFVGEPD